MEVDSKDLVEDLVEGEEKEEKHLVSKQSDYYLEDNELFHVRCSSVKDEVEGQYVLDVNQPLPNLDTGMAKAYAVTDKSTGSKDKYYAVVLDKRYPVRLAEINLLIVHKPENIVRVMGAQMITSSLGEGRFFVVVLERPRGITFSEYIATQGSVSETAIFTRVVPALVDVVNFFVTHNVVHGKINADNVYIDGVGNITVGECVSEICGYSQQALYEHVDRTMALPMGKGVGYVGSTDLYAVGVFSAVILRGANLLLAMSDADLLDLRLTVPSYKVVTDKLALSPRFVDLFRGTINDTVAEIWSVEHVCNWLKGRIFNLLPPSDNIEAGRPIMFNGKKYWNKRHLAHALYIDWDVGKKFIDEPTLVRWVERSVQDVELAESMHVLANRLIPNVDDMFDMNDELLSQYIILLDPQGPIRVPNFASAVDGLGVLLAHGYAERPEYVKLVERIIYQRLVTYWNSERMALKISEQMQHAIFALQKCLEMLRKKDLGFGIERCLYDLNPTLSCQSEKLRDDMMLNVSEYLVSMDHDEQLDKVVMDNHVAAFLSSRLDLAVRIRVPSLVKFPDYAVNIYVQILALLSLAQQASGIESLVGLSNKVVNSLAEVVNGFHSAVVRKELVELLKECAVHGSVPEVLAVMSDSKHLVRDRLGFRKAVGAYNSNAIQIARLKNRKAINNMGYQYGLQLAVFMSFFIVAVSFILLVVQSF